MGIWIRQRDGHDVSGVILSTRRGCPHGGCSARDLRETRVSRAHPGPDLPSERTRGTHCRAGLDLQFVQGVARTADKGRDPGRAQLVGRALRRGRQTSGRDRDDGEVDVVLSKKRKISPAGMPLPRCWTAQLSARSAAAAMAAGKL